MQAGRLRRAGCPRIGARGAVVPLVTCQLHDVPTSGESTPMGPIGHMRLMCPADHRPRPCSPKNEDEDDDENEYEPLYPTPRKDP
jgi:hypothetical protein